jgi:hypothetical protein
VVAVLYKLNSELHPNIASKKKKEKIDISRYAIGSAQLATFVLV